MRINSGILKEALKQKEDLLNAWAETDWKMGGNKRIFLVDDCQSSLQLMQFYLGKMGNMHVDSFDNEFRALEYSTMYPPDLLIMDMNLDKLNGMDVAKVMSALTLKPIPTVFISRDEKFEPAVNELNDGSIFIPKPLNRNDFITAVRSSFHSRITKAVS